MGRQTLIRFHATQHCDSRVILLFRCTFFTESHFVYLYIWVCSVLYVLWLYMCVIRCILHWLTSADKMVIGLLMLRHGFVLAIWQICWSNIDWTVWTVVVSGVCAYIVVYLIRHGTTNPDSLPRNSTLWLSSYSIVPLYFFHWISFCLYVYMSV